MARVAIGADLQRAIVRGLSWVVQQTPPPQTFEMEAFAKMVEKAELIIFCMPEGENG